MVANFSRVFKVGMTEEMGGAKHALWILGGISGQVEGTAGTKALRADCASHI